MMSNKKILLAIPLLLILFGCEFNPNGTEQAYLRQKDGDSCLLTHQCKVVVSRGDQSRNRLYKCFLSDEYYKLVSEKEVIQVKMSACEEILP